MQLGRETLWLMKGISDGSTTCSDLGAQYYYIQLYWEWLITDMNSRDLALPTWSEFINAFRSELYDTYTCEWKNCEILGQEI